MYSDWDYFSLSAVRDQLVSYWLTRLWLHYGCFSWWVWLPLASQQLYTKKIKVAEAVGLGWCPSHSLAPVGRSCLWPTSFKLRSSIKTVNITANIKQCMKTYTCLTAFFPGQPGYAVTRRVKPIWILMKQETMGGGGITWTIFKSYAPLPKWVTVPLPGLSVFTNRMHLC